MVYFTTNTVCVSPRVHHDKRCVSFVSRLLYNQTVWPNKSRVWNMTLWRPYICILAVKPWSALAYPTTDYLSGNSCTAPSVFPCCQSYRIHNKLYRYVYSICNRDNPRQPPPEITSPMTSLPVQGMVSPLLYKYENHQMGAFEDPRISLSSQAGLINLLFFTDGSLHQSLAIRDNWQSSELVLCPFASSMPLGASVYYVCLGIVSPCRILRNERPPVWQPYHPYKPNLGYWAACMAL